MTANCPTCGGPLPGIPGLVWVFGAFPLGHHVYLIDRTMVRQSVPREIVDQCDSALARGAPQPEGRRAKQWIIEHDGRPWSFVSWYDRQGDSRHGSHTGILAKGRWSPVQLVEAGRKLAPWAFRVEVVL